MLKKPGAAIASAATFVAAVALCIGSAATAFADTAVTGPDTQNLGSAANIGGGSSVQAWTVSNLKQSSDVIPYQPHGTLWEATATDEAVQGGATPFVSNLNATSPGGQVYRVLYQVATPQGVNPAGLAQGQKTTGKVYFDVTGDNPTAVVFRDADGHDLASWVQPPPTKGGKGAHASPSGTGTQAPSPAANKPATPAGNPSAAGSQGTPIASGSQGTPTAGGAPVASPAVSPGAPAPASSPGAPAPAGSPELPAGTPPAAGNPEAPVPGAPPPGPAPAQTAPGSPQTGTGSQGTPASAGSPEAPAPAPASPGPAAPALAPGQPPAPAGGGTALPPGSQGQNAGPSTP